MNNAALLGFLHKSLPDHFRFEKSFFKIEAEYIISGFLLEITANGIYVWQLIFPLFDPFEKISLLYSKRLDGGYFPQEGKNDIPEKIIELIKKNPSPTHFANLEDFCRFIQSKPTLAEHPHARMVMGFAEILLEERIAAKAHIDGIVDQINPAFKNICSDVSRALATNLADAVSLVQALNVKKRKELGIES